MKTITKTYEVYSYDELDESAKETALAEFYSDEYFWGDDNKSVLDRFEEIFPIEVKNWEYGDCGAFVSFEFSYNYSEVKELTGIRLLKYLVNNYYHALFTAKYISKYTNNHKHISRHSKCQVDNCCVLTGYYIDHAILDPIYKFLKNPDKNTTFYDLMNYCLQSWVSACQVDYEYQYSREGIEQTIEANEYLFTSNGKLFSMV